jgi:DNA-binding transcriptional MerR regulator
MRFTVSQIAEILVEPAYQPALIERIRHWTREGLVHPVGAKNPGTGRHREYEDPALVEIAVLEALADLGLQIRQQHSALKILREKMRDGDTWYEWMDKVRKGIPVYLAFSNLGGETPTFKELFAHINRETKLHELKFNALTRGTILVNFTSLIQKISKGYQILQSENN